jgi:hypothetical protein
VADDDRQMSKRDWLVVLGVFASLILVCNIAKAFNTANGQIETTTTEVAEVETKEQCINRVTNETLDDHRRQGKSTLTREDVERFTYDVASSCKLGRFK